MKHLSSIVLVAAVVAAGTVACFKDPTSSLRKGATRIELTQTAVTLVTGDSLAIQAEVKDAQGNTYDAGSVEWTSDNSAVASVVKDAGTYIPYGAFSKAFVLGAGPAGGVAHITATSANLTATLRVLNLPARLTALATPAVSGTASADTIPGSVGPPLIPTVVFSAGDTVTITTTAGSNLTFNATASKVDFGANAAYIVSRTATAIKVIAPARPFAGRPWVTLLSWAGPAEVGTVAIDSLESDSVLVAKPRYRGAITQLGDTMFLAAQTGTKFSATSAVRFGATTAVALAQDSVNLKVISPATYTGPVTVTLVKVGAATVDSLKTVGAYTINQAAFGGTVTAPGNLLDTVKVQGTALTKLDTGSVVRFGGAPSWIVRKFPTSGSTTKLDSVYVIPQRPSSGPAVISRVNVGGTIIPQLSTAGNVVIHETPTDEPNEPANDNPDVVAINFLSATAANPFILYGAENEGTDFDDLFSFTLAAARDVHISLQWYGTNSSAGTADDPDLDLYLCNVGCTTAVKQSAGASDPEALTVTALPAGSYNIYVNAYGTGGATRPYRLVIY
jgi:hypothetical protein